MKKTFIPCIFIIPMVMACTPLKHGSADTINKKNFCKTRYPLILVHGLGVRDDYKLLKYWGNIPQHLRKRGARVFLAHQQAFASHQDNALMIKKEINRILKEHPGFTKVNIIAHSKGGLESRYMISRLGMSDKVASLTTIATPHRGSAIADIVMGKIKTDKKFVVKFINRIARLLGDKRPDSYDAGKELTTEYMRKFNSDVKDMRGVFYQSYAAEINQSYPNPFWRKMWEILNRHDGPNDSLVSIRSAQWGTFRGVVKQKGKTRVSHADIVGLHIATGVFGFKEENFFADLVHELKMRGY